MIIGLPAKLADYLLVVWALVVAVHLNVLCHQLFLLRLPFLTRSDELNIRFPEVLGRAHPLTKKTLGIYYSNNNKHNTIRSVQDQAPPTI
jgi:hypothetical protein